jgi:hypothetical protein
MKWLGVAVAGMAFALGCSGGGSGATTGDDQNAKAAAESPNAPPFDGKGAGTAIKLNGHDVEVLALSDGAKALVDRMEAWAARSTRPSKGQSTG